MRREDVKPILLVSLLSLTILFCVSPDSYTHHLNGHGDSSWFYMCGKAWMNGMTPYVDFSDSKGPLLWLIYGIGYLLSPTNYLGVFWLSWIAYTITFFLTWTTARIWLSERSSYMATVLMSLAYFNPLLHYEIRCEDFCLPFILLSLYLTCRALYASPDHKRTSATSFILGFAFGCLLLLKYNLAAMQSIFPLIILLWSFKEKRQPWRQFFFITAGFLTITLPFLLWFALHGNLGAMVQEYFVLTYKTTSHNSDTSNFVLGFLSPLTLIIALAMLALGIIGILLVTYRLSRWRWVPLIAFLFFFIIIVQNATCNYYYTIGTPFLLFLAIGFCMHLPSHWQMWMERHVSWLSGLTVLLCVYFNIEMNDKIGNLFYQDSPQFRSYSEISSAMSLKEHPTVVYLGFMNGYDVPPKALPGCKYYARQDGELPFMLNEALTACAGQKADFVIVDIDSTAYRRHVELSGYHPMIVDSVTSRQVLYGLLSQPSQRENKDER